MENVVLLNIVPFFFNFRPSTDIVKSTSDWNDRNWTGVFQTDSTQIMMDNPYRLTSTFTHRFTGKWDELSNVKSLPLANMTGIDTDISKLSPIVIQQQKKHLRATMKMQAIDSNITEKYCSNLAENVKTNTSCCAIMLNSQGITITPLQSTYLQNLPVQVLRAKS